MKTNDRPADGQRPSAPSPAEIRMFCDTNYTKCCRGRIFVLYKFAEMLVKWCLDRQNDSDTVENDKKE